MSIYSSSYKPLTGIQIVSVAQNLPGPLAIKRLVEFGANVIKIEPPSGDGMSVYSPEWYAELNEGICIERLDLKTESDRQQMSKLLSEAALLVSAQRPSALNKLGLGWEDLSKIYPKLNYLQIIGFPPPNEEHAGHDLTYQASMGILQPPSLPKSLIADMVGAERAAQIAMGLLMGYQAGRDGEFRQFTLSESAEYMALPLKYQLTSEQGVLGGASAEYNLYRTKTTWIAIAALEPHFKKRLKTQLQIEDLSRQSLREIFSKKSTKHWIEWAEKFDIPIAEVREIEKQAG